MTITLGIDEAGRGAVVGPLVMYGVVVQNRFLEDMGGIEDSKQLTPAKRGMLAPIIKESCIYSCAIADAKMVDEYVAQNRLNALERDLASLIIDHCKRYLGPRRLRIVLDGADIFSPLIETYQTNNVEVFAEPKADQNYISVAAASILAKDHRDTVVRKIMDEGFKGGSGYPNNATEAWIDNLIVTSSCLAEIEHGAQHIRRSWKWKGLEALKEKLDAKR